MPIRVVLVESSPVLRVALREYLIRHGRGIAVVGEAGDVDEAARQVTDSRPDVVVIDLQMPEGSEWECVKRIHDQAPESCIILVSWRPQEVLAEDMRKLGVCTVVEKSRLPASVIEVIEKCGGGSCLGLAGLHELRPH